MSLRGRSWRGSAGIVIWNGVAPGAAAEFERWHDEEHLAERLAIPGFLRARRGVAVDGSARYLTLYDVADAYAIGQGALVSGLPLSTRVVSFGGFALSWASGSASAAWTSATAQRSLDVGILRRPTESDLFASNNDLALDLVDRRRPRPHSSLLPTLRRR